MAGQGRRVSRMKFFLLKTLIAGLIVAAVSSLGKRYPIWGGILAALPIISVLAFSFLYYETGDSQQVAKLSFSVGWFALSSASILLLLPFLLHRQFSFVKALMICIVVLVILDIIIFNLLKKLTQ
jgi:hypothetical protein